MRLPAARWSIFFPLYSAHGEIYPYVDIQVSSLCEAKVATLISYLAPLLSPVVRFRDPFPFGNRGNPVVYACAPMKEKEKVSGVPNSIIGSIM